MSRKSAVINRQHLADNERREVFKTFIGYAVTVIVYKAVRNMLYRICNIMYIAGLNAYGIFTRISDEHHHTPAPATECLKYRRSAYLNSLGYVCT